MGLTAWTGSRPHRDDGGIAKNYLPHEKMTLNLIASAYLDFAELQGARPQADDDARVPPARGR
jgi:hypothetical protein